MKMQSLFRVGSLLTTLTVHALTATAFAASVLPAQGPPPVVRAVPATASTLRWTVASPEASLAWFALVADLRLQGAGAFAFVIADSVRAASPLAVALAQSRDFEILHFVPLYYPTADRAALVAALRAAAATPAVAPAPRAALLVSALTSALAPDVRRARLPELASALERTRAEAPTAARLAHWQQQLDTLYGPALGPWLRAEQLDGGRLVVSPSIGAEGRLFAGTTDRADNIIAVGTTVNDPDPEAPLLAYVRELCFPAVTRATTSVRGFNTEDPRAARRASLAAVRCGAELLDRLLPARANAYRAFWLRAANNAHVGVAPIANTPIAARFDAVFPADPALQPALTISLRRVPAIGQ